MCILLCFFGFMVAKANRRLMRLSYLHASHHPRYRFVSDNISLSVKFQNGLRVSIVVPLTDGLGTHLAAACQWLGYPGSMVRFLFDGLAVNSNSTPSDMGLSSGDEVDAMLMQIGGAMAWVPSSDMKVPQQRGPPHAHVFPWPWMPPNAQQFPEDVD